MRLKIGQKIFGIALVVLIFMVTVAVYSIRLTANISDELDTIAGKHMPVTEAVTRVNVRTLEQGVLLQRLFVLVEDDSPNKSVARNRKRFDNLGAKIAGEFEKARQLLRTDARVATLKKSLIAIETAHKTFTEHGDKLVAARMAGDLHLFNTLAPILNSHQDAVNAEIAKLRRHIEGLTNAAVLRADRDEKTLLTTNIILTAFAALLGFGFALIVTRVIVRAVRNLVAGTEAVEGGDLDTEVPVTSRDEIGRLTSSFNHMVGELRLKERIKETFGKYMDPRIVTNLLDHPEFAEPGGERREMTVMFIDLKGFTSISEALAPDDLIKMMNRFFGHMTDAISENNGVVDKFMGDAVMAFWGPPFTAADEHATLACRAAVQALEHLEMFRNDVKRELGSKAESLDIDLRIGVSTGEMIVGTVGSRVSMSFTIMGDPVNLGARLEGANKAYGTRAMVSERTRDLAGDGVALRELDLIKVKGKNEPTRVYELLAELNGQPGLDSFQVGLEAYRKQNWDAADTAFKACLDSNPDDSAAAVYLDRVAHLRAEPPPAGWDGVWVFETK